MEGEQGERGGEVAEGEDGEEEDCGEEGEGEGGDRGEGCEFCQRGRVGVVPDDEEEGDGKEKKERLWHEGGGQIEIHRAQEEEEIGPEDGGWRERAFPKGLEKKKGGDPEEKGGEATGGVEGQEWQGGVESESGEVVNREFQGEAGIEIAAPRGDGVEAEGAVFEHPGSECGGLGVAVAFGDGRSQNNDQQNKQKKRQKNLLLTIFRHLRIPKKLIVRHKPN